MIQTDDVYFVAADLTGARVQKVMREMRMAVNTGEALPSCHLPPAVWPGFWQELVPGLGEPCPRLALQLLLVTRSSQLYPMYSTVL